MPDVVFSPAVPANPRNYVVPSKIQMFFRSTCPDGSLDDPVSLGSVSDIEFTPNETTIELKSAYLGILTTDKRVITDVSGTLSFKIHEIAGTNVNLLFRPVTIETRSVAANTGALVFGQVRFTMTGTTPTEIAPRDPEYDAVTGAVVKPDLTLVRVESSDVVDPVTGRGFQYEQDVDYTFVQSTGSTAQGFTFDTGTNGPFLAATQLDGSPGLSFRDGPGDSLDPVTTWGANGAVEVTYANGNQLPIVGENITPTAIAAAVVEKVETGSTASAGRIWVIYSAAVGWDSLAGTAATGDNGFTGNLTTVARASHASGNTGTGFAAGTPGTNNSVSGVVEFTPADLTGEFEPGTSVEFINASDVSQFVATVDEAANTAASATIDAADYGASLAAGTLTVSDVTGTFLAGLGISVTGGTNPAATLTAKNALNNVIGATLQRTSGSRIPDGAEVNVTFQYTRSGKAYSILDGVILEGELTLQVLSVNGPQSLYRFFRVNLAIDGSITMSPEERMEPTIQATILPDGRGRRGEFVLFDGFSNFALTDCA